MMCRRGGSKGGKHPAGSAWNTHQNTNRGNAGQPQTSEKNPSGRNTH